MASFQTFWSGSVICDAILYDVQHHEGSDSVIFGPLDFNWFLDFDELKSNLT